MTARYLTAMVLSFALASCGGGGGAGGGSTVPQGPAQPAQNAKGRAELSLFVPNASSPGTTKRRDLPATTQSVEIVVANADGTSNSQTSTPTVVNISATAPGCSSGTSGISCTINVTAPFGSVLFAVVAYTGQNATGNPIAWGYTFATISATASNAVSITTTSVSVYETMNLDGNFSLASIDHNMMTLTVVEASNSSTITASLQYLPNGDLQGTVTSVTGSTNEGLGDIVYLRELPGSMLTFLSTGQTGTTGAPVTTGADWGVGVAVIGCPTMSSNAQISGVTVAGPAFTNSPTGNVAYTNGTAAITVSGGTASLAFTGTGYNVTGGSVQSESGGTATCTGGLFSGSGTGTSSTSGTGAVVASNGGSSGSATSVVDGTMGFVETAGSSPNLAAVEAGTYDGFLGLYTGTGQTTRAGAPINVTASGTTFTACPYSSISTNGLSTTCLTLTLGAATMQPGIYLATGTSPSNPSGSPGVVAIQRVSGKYVIFGLTGAENFALIQH